MTLEPQIDPKKTLSKLKTHNLKRDELHQEIDEAVIYLDLEIERQNSLKKKLLAEKRPIEPTPRMVTVSNRSWDIPIILGFFMVIFGFIGIILASVVKK